MGVLKEEFPHLEKTPLKMEGLVRSVRLGDKLYEMAAPRQVIISINSGKDRAELTGAIATRRVSQRESNKKNEEKKRIDMLQIESEELIALLKDADDSTWGLYGDMIKNDGISEADAILRWLADMNKVDAGVSSDVHPHEASERYRKLIALVREKIQVGKDKQGNDIPLMLFGVGHSGSLGQIRHEDMGQANNPGDVPQFCEMYQFDNNGKLLKTEHVDL